MDPVAAVRQQGQFANQIRTQRDEKLIQSSHNLVCKSYDEIKMFLSIREKLEERMRVVLNDYQQMINQMTLVSTLVVGFSVGHAGELLGNVDGQPEWKKTMHNTATLLGTIFGLMSVLEGVFYSVRLNIVEAKFLSGRYPLAVSREKAVPYLDTEVIKDLNARYNAIFLFFCVSIFAFSVALMASMSVSQGLSTELFVDDEQYDESQWVPATISYWILLSFFWIWSLCRFIGSWASNIHASKLAWFFRNVFCCGNLQITDSDNIRRPLQILADRFRNNQIHLYCCLRDWEQKAYQLIRVLVKQREAYTIATPLWEEIQRNNDTLQVNDSTIWGWITSAAKYVFDFAETGDPRTAEITQTGLDAQAREALESIRVQLRIVEKMKSHDQADTDDAEYHLYETPQEKCTYFWTNVIYVLLTPFQLIITMMSMPFLCCVSQHKVWKVACACCLSWIRKNDELYAIVEDRQRREVEARGIQRGTVECNYIQVNHLKF